MASYKQPCQHCGNLIDSDARYCTFCFSRSPFGYQCPACFKRIEKGQRLCSSCGHPLYVACPHCGQETFVDDRCDQCGQSLLFQCPNSLCGQMQFFMNTTCTACGKPIVNKKKRK